MIRVDFMDRRREWPIRVR